VLVSEGLNAKIADFGHAREDDEDNLTKNDRGPLKWMAPEALMESAYSTKTDVWAFGITVVEIYTRDLPYPGQQGVKVAAKVAAGNLTHPLPENAPGIVQKVMTMCLAFDPEKRPEFRKIAKLLG
jgi:serine/threonine protein kinase